MYNCFERIHPKKYLTGKAVSQCRLEPLLPGKRDNVLILIQGSVAEPCGLVVTLNEGSVTIYRNVSVDFTDTCTNSMGGWMIGNTMISYHQT